MIDERRDFQKPPPIQRIILYIDDLDRCKPERVVEVLEAIHLLLFFPLFVVVVAVDPRWLRHSLIQHYPATLNKSGGMVLLDDRMGISLYSTPQDYLEKIFQIPFALRPVERGGYQSLVDDLLKPLPSRKQQKAPDLPPLTRDESGEPGETITTGFDQTKPNEIAVGTTTDEVDLEPSIEREQQEEQAEIPESPAETSFTPIPPRQLEFTEWEKENIQQLWLMFRTPRTVKRFINIYRLLRAGLISDTELKNFEGTRRKPGDYQVALLLLATITAFPNEASQLLYRLDSWLDVQEKNKKRRVTNWSELIEYLKQEPDDSTQKILTNSKKDQKSEAKFEQTEGPKEKTLDMEPIDSNQTSESSWNLMLDCIRRVTQDSAWNKNFKITALRTWIMRVARFSFSVQPT